MKVNFKVKMKVTIEFLVEIYVRNDFHFFEKYFTWLVNLIFGFHMNWKKFI